MRWALLLLAATGVSAADCSQWHSLEFFKTATLDAGADPKAADLEGKLPWDYARDREGLAGSDAYWRLRDAWEASRRQVS